MNFPQPISRAPCSPPHATSHLAAQHGLKRDTYKFTASKDLAGKRLDVAITAEVPDISRGKVGQSIKSGKVLVNGVVKQKAGLKVKNGDVVVFTLPDVSPMCHVAPEAGGLIVHYEDKHCLVVRKPAGLLTHPGGSQNTGTLVNRLLHHFGLQAVSVDEDGLVPASFDEAAQIQRGNSGTLSVEHTEWSPTAPHQQYDAQPSHPSAQSPVSTSADDVAQLVQPARDGEAPVLRPGIVHRLDKGTTGVMVVAKHARALRILMAQFQARTVHRLYTSLCVGCPRESEGEIKSNIVRCDAHDGTFVTCDFEGNKGRTAISTYKVLRKFARGSFSIVQWKLHTGRTHQIRVHARSIGHSLVSDTAYGGTQESARSQLRQNYQLEWSRNEWEAAYEDRRVQVAGSGCTSTGNLGPFQAPTQSDVQAAKPGLKDTPAVQRQSQGGQEGVRGGQTKVEGVNAYATANTSGGSGRKRQGGKNQGKRGGAKSRGTQVDDLPKEVIQAIVDVDVAVGALERPALHAGLLSFDHPENGERLTFQDGVPEDMQALIDKLECLDCLGVGGGG